MEMPRYDDPLQWKVREKRSKRPSSPLQLDAGEIATAEYLILLANSGGGFCSTVIGTASTIFTPKKHQELSHSAKATAGDTIPATVIFKKQEAASPDTPLLPTYNDNHHCWVCGKVFQSFQALGGHMTSHRVKIGDATVSGDKGRRDSAASSGRVHECSCCHQQFATGQALGGHKRKHYNGRTLARKAAKCNSTFFNRIAGDSS